MERAEGYGLVLHEDELRILLYGRGYRQCEGIFMPEKDFSEEEILRALQDMSRRRLIYEEGGTFSMREDLEKIVRIVGSPAATCILRSADGLFTCFCHMAPGWVVVSEPYRRRPSSLLLRLQGTDAFLQWKKENAFTELSVEGALPQPGEGGEADADTGEGKEHAAIVSLPGGVIM